MTAPALLDGTRVLDLADETGAYCGKLLADLGATVVYVEPPEGNRIRQVGPFFEDPAGGRHSLTHWYLNTNKLGVVLDLGDAADREAFLGLARTADAIIDTPETSALGRSGLTWDVLHRLHPALTLASISGFGREGPYRGFRSDDLVISAMGQWLYAAGEPTGRPTQHRAPLTHYFAGVQAAQGVLLALLARHRTGGGQRVDVSAQRTMASCVWDWGVTRYFFGHRLIHHRWAGVDMWDHFPFAPYPCRDGYVWLLAIRPRMWTVLAAWVFEVTGEIEILDGQWDDPAERARPASRQRLRPILEAFTAQMTRDELWQGARQRDLPITPCLTVDEVASMEQLHARGYFVELEHDEVGLSVTYPGAPHGVRGEGWSLRHRAPLLGEHTEAVIEAGGGWSVATAGAGARR